MSLYASWVRSPIGGLPHRGPGVARQRLATAIHRQALACSAACCLWGLGACAPSYPVIAEVRGDAAFKARIATRYPPGSSGQVLRTELARKNFQFIEDPTARRYSALEIPPNLPCFSQVRIDWTEDARGRIRLIQAARHSCS